MLLFSETHLLTNSFPPKIFYLHILFTILSFNDSINKGIPFSSKLLFFMKYIIKLKGEAYLFSSFIRIYTLKITKCINLVSCHIT